jgi:hypothetical protein
MALFDVNSDIGNGGSVMKRFNVEVNYPNGTGRTTQVSAETSSQAASRALTDYPAADNVTAWLPGGSRGLDRTDAVTLTGFARATEGPTPQFPDTWLPWGMLRSVWL